MYVHSQVLHKDLVLPEPWCRREGPCSPQERRGGFLRHRGTASLEAKARQLCSALHTNTLRAFSRSFTPGSLVWVEVKTFKSVCSLQSSCGPASYCGRGHGRAAASARSGENPLSGGEAAAVVISGSVEIRGARVLVPARLLPGHTRQPGLGACVSSLPRLSRNGRGAAAPPLPQPLGCPGQTDGPSQP